MYPVPLRQGVPRLQRMLCVCPSLCRVSRRFFAWGCACLVLCIISWQPACADPGKDASAPQWVHMPAGARSAYIGIHGGTVPVSLLTSRDGTHMVALVGETGNDFLRILKVDSGTTGALPPTLSAFPDEAGTDTVRLNQRAAAAALPSLQRTTNATLLMAGTAVGAMPVIYATGHSFASLNQLYTDSLLFGISEHSPLLEGSVKAPLKATKSANAIKRRPLLQESSAPINQ